MLAHHNFKNTLLRVAEPKMKKAKKGQNVFQSSWSNYVIFMGFITLSSNNVCHVIIMGVHVGKDRREILGENLNLINDHSDA